MSFLLHTMICESLYFSSGKLEGDFPLVIGAAAQLKALIYEQ